MNDRRQDLRRTEDVSRDEIAAAVRNELVRQRRRWLAVWLLTLAFSAWAWHVAAQANDRVQRQADATDKTAVRAAAQAKLICQRARLIAPEIVADYERRGVLDGPKLEAYKSLLPKGC